MEKQRFTFASNGMTDNDKGLFIGFTEWFPGDETPAFPGEYEVKGNGLKDGLMLKWTGVRWLTRAGGEALVWSTDKWRGLVASAYAL